MTSYVQTFFNELLPAAMAQKPENFKEIGEKYTFNITGEGGGEWYVDASDSGPSVAQGDLGNSNCIVTINSENFEQICRDSSVIMQLYFQGLIMISGDPMAFAKASKIFTLGN